MKRASAVLSGVLLAALMAVPAMAGPVSLSLHDGHVTLTARDATVQQILAEWSKVGRTKFVNAGKVVSPPMTLHLSNVPEAQALAIVLDSAAGYMAAPRHTYVPNASVYDRVLILATSHAPSVSTPVRSERRPTTFYPPQFRGFRPPSALRFFRPPPRPPSANGKGNSTPNSGATPNNGSISAPIVSAQPGIIVKTKKKSGSGGGGR